MLINNQRSTLNYCYQHFNLLNEVREKAATPVKFGAKLDLSIDENGMARLEKLSFNAYNESDVLIGVLERYRKRTGHYPERILADKIYRTAGT